MSIRLTIIAEIRKVAEEQKRKLAPLSDSLALMDSGLDSLCFATLIARLEDALGSDPLSETDNIGFPVTLGDLVRLYENAAAEPAMEPPKIGSFKAEAFSQNVARLVEEGGKALAAYLKSREEGKIKGELANDATDVVKTVGQVASYWFSDPRRALELQTALGRAYLDLWAGAVKRMAGDPAAPVVTPDAKDKRFADAEWSENQFF